MNQFQRMKQQPVQAPQTPPTIRDQLNMAEKQQAQQQMAMQQGLGGMPAPAMEQAQFAGGGIVAFSQGGLTAEEEAELDALKQLREDIRMGEKITGGRFAGLSGITPASPEKAGLYELQRARLTELERKAAKAKEASGLAARNAGIAAEAKRRGISLPKPVVAQTAVPPKTDVAAPVLKREPPAAPRVAAAPVASAVPAAPKTLSVADYEREYQERNKPLTEAIERQRAFLQSDEATSKEETKRDRMLTLAQAGFAMAEAASKPGATFLGSAGAAGGGYAKNMMQLNREAAVAKRNMQKELLALDQAKAANDVNMYNASLGNFIKEREFVTQVDQFNQGQRLQQAKLALDEVLGKGQIGASIANAEATLGLRGAELAGRSTAERNDLAVKTIALADKRRGELILTREFREATPEEQQTILNNLIPQAAKEIATLLGEGGMSDAVRAADKIVGGTG